MERYGKCVRNHGMHRKVWDAQEGLACTERFGMHGEHTGSMAGQGHLAHHVPTVCAQGVVAPGGDSSGISWQSCPGTSPATAARNTVTGRRRKPTSHLGRRSIQLPWVSTQQLPKYIIYIHKYIHIYTHKYVHTHTILYSTPSSPPALLHKILTESPTARITIPDIQKDRWYSRPLKKGKGPPGSALVAPDLRVIGCPVPLQMSSRLGSPRGRSLTPLEASPSTSDPIQTSHQ